MFLLSFIILMQASLIPLDAFRDPQVKNCGGAISRQCMLYLRGESYFGIRMKQRRDFCRVMRNTTVVDNIRVRSLRVGEDFDLLLNIFTLSRFV